MTENEKDFVCGAFPVSRIPAGGEQNKVMASVKGLCKRKTLLKLHVFS